MKLGEDGLRVTDPVSLLSGCGAPTALGVPGCEGAPSLVTLTLNRGDWPAFTVVFNDVWRTNSELPVGVPPLIDSASCTALRVSTRPAPWRSAGGPRSWAVLTMICLTSSGEG